MTASSLLAWICCLFVFLASLQQQAFAAPHNWTQQNPRVTMASLYSAAYGAGQYVVAGELEQPVVLISKDLKSWQTVATPSISVGSPFSGFYVAYGPTAGFVLVGGQSSATLTSIDGKNWQAHAQEYSPYLRQVVVYGNGLYVSAPLDGSSLYVSTNGADWQISMMPDMDFNIVGVLFNTNNGQFLVYGYGSGDDNGVIYSSVDGNVWNVFSNISSFLSYPVNQIDSITQGPGNSLLATVDIQGYGVIVYSPDGGKTWQVVYDLSNGYGFSSVSYGKGVFFAQVYSQATGEELLTSTDNGKSWSVVSSSAVAGFPQFVNGVWMVLGARGLIQTSLDGKSFVTFNQGITDQLQQFLSPPSDINSQPAFFLTFQDYTTGSPSGTYASNDGIQWKVISDRAVTLIKWSADYNAWLGLFNSQLAFSSDMVQWQTLEGPTLPPAPAKGSVYIQDFAFYNDTWAVLVTIRNEYFPVGYRVFTSRGVGPKYWDTTLSSDQLATELLAVTAGNGIFLVESSSGRFHYSLDGSNWQVSALQSSLGAAGGDQLFYVGQDGEGLLCYLPEEGLFANTSSDGLNWQTVSFGSGKKIVGIFYQEQLGGIVMSLTDGSFRAWNGKSWVMTDVIKGSGGVHNVGWHNGQLVAVNTLTNGIFTAPVVSPP